MPFPVKQVFYYIANCLLLIANCHLSQAIIFFNLSILFNGKEKKHLLYSLGFWRWKKTVHFGSPVSGDEKKSFNSFSSFYLVKFCLAFRPHNLVGRNFNLYFVPSLLIHANWPSISFSCF